MNLIAIALVGLLTVGLLNQPNPNFPSEKMNLTPVQSQQLSANLVKTLKDHLPPANIILVFEHNKTHLSIAIEAALRQQGYAIINQNDEGSTHRLSYAIDAIQDEWAVVELSISNGLTWTQAFSVQGETVTPMGAASFKHHDS